MPSVNQEVGCLTRHQTYPCLDLRPPPPDLGPTPAWILDLPPPGSWICPAWILGPTPTWILDLPCLDLEPPLPLPVPDLRPAPGLDLGPTPAWTYPPPPGSWTYTPQSLVKPSVCGVLLEQQEQTVLWHR